MSISSITGILGFIIGAGVVSLMVVGWLIKAQMDSMDANGDPNDNNL